MKIHSEETEIRGSWIIVDSSIEADYNTTRIEYLTQNYLIEIAVSDDGWEKLFQDPSDKRYWELIYPESELQGGGAPTLRSISIFDAKSKFGNI